MEMHWEIDLQFDLHVGQFYPESVILQSIVTEYVFVRNSENYILTNMCNALL